MDYPDPTVEESLLGSDGEMLCFALDRVRKEFAWKTDGLEAAQLRRRHPPSTMTWAGLIKHMAFVEDGFTATAQGRPSGFLHDHRDEDGRDEWESALTDDPDDLYALWYGAVERSRNAWAEMITNEGLNAIIADPDPAWTKNRRRVLVDLLEENLIHLGHVDLLREAIDGRRGHGWPEPEPDEMA
ncbi:MAG: DUF664 domain-containing protein [Propionibacteriaceae bacterium]